MKTSEQRILGLFLFVLCSLSIQRAAARDAPAGAGNIGTIALCFPLKAEETTLSQVSSLDFGSEADKERCWRLIGETFERQQTLPNGSPYPEAVSLARLMEASLCAEAKVGSVVSVDSDVFKVFQGERSWLSFLQAKALQNADAAVLVLYTTQETHMEFWVLLLTNTGSASYVSGVRSVFELAEATREAVRALVAKSILEPPASRLSDSSSGRSSAMSSTLPVIEPWKDKPKYDQANARFQFSIGGVAVGLSASMVSLGFWQNYQEAAFRNASFEGAVTASAIATGTCVAVTVAFLTSAIWNAVLMLQTSR